MKEVNLIKYSFGTVEYEGPELVVYVNENSSVIFFDFALLHFDVLKKRNELFEHFKRLFTVLFVKLNHVDFFSFVNYCNQLFPRLFGIAFFQVF